MIVYVSGPFSADTTAGVLANIENAMRAGKALLDAGHAPIIPHLNHLYDIWHDQTFGAPVAYDVFLDWDVAIVRRSCDAVLRLPGESRGADREVAVARDAGIPVYHALADIPDA